MNKSQKIIDYLKTKETATKSELYAISDYQYYRNWGKHFGDVLSRLVDNGMLKRVKQGVYSIGEGAKKSEQIEDKNQLKLL